VDKDALVKDFPIVLIVVGLAFIELPFLQDSLHKTLDFVLEVLQLILLFSA
jgi:hypothetical protein